MYEYSASMTCEQAFEMATRVVYGSYPCAVAPASIFILIYSDTHFIYIHREHSLLHIPLDQIGKKSRKSMLIYSNITTF